jgi:hypothetical protein
MGAFLDRVIDQLNPLNPGNLLLYFVTVFVYSYTAVAVWLARRASWRFLCFIVNQVFSFGVFISWTVAVVITYTYWSYALAMAGFGVFTAFSLWLLLRNRSRRRELRLLMRS